MSSAIPCHVAANTSISLNAQYLSHIHHIERRHFNSTAKKVGFGESAETLLEELIARTPEVVAQVQAELPVGFSERVADKVLGGLLKSARSLGQSGG